MEEGTTTEGTGELEEGGGGEEGVLGMLAAAEAVGDGKGGRRRGRRGGEGDVMEEGRVRRRGGLGEDEGGMRQEEIGCDEEGQDWEQEDQQRPEGREEEAHRNYCQGNRGHWSDKEQGSGGCRLFCLFFEEDGLAERAI